MNPTIHDVAGMAGTSKSTVSRYLNGGKVKRETQIALEKAIKELNFHRNMNARRLVVTKTHNVAVVVDDISNIFYSGIIRGIESVCTELGYNCLFLSSTSNYNQESSYLKLLYEGQADGMILISFRKRDESELSVIKDSPYPVVLVGDSGRAEELVTVDVDNYSGISQMMAYLHRLGHRNVAYISGPDSMAASESRLKGYLDSLDVLRMTYNPAWIVRSDWSNPGGYRSMEQLLQAGGFTAVLASNDDTAIGALRCMQEQGYSVPRNISCTGFDDISISGWVYPPLTTVRQPFLEMGRQAAVALIDKISGREPEHRHLLLKPELIVRQSCEKVQETK